MNLFDCSILPTVSMRLTVTKVVFELTLKPQQPTAFDGLTVTKVVFELKVEKLKLV